MPFREALDSFNNIHLGRSRQLKLRVRNNNHFESELANKPITQ